MRHGTGLVWRGLLRLALAGALGFTAHRLATNATGDVFATSTFISRMDSTKCNCEDSDTAKCAPSWTHCAHAPTELDGVVRVRTKRVRAPHKLQHFTRRFTFPAHTDPRPKRAFSAFVRVRAAEGTAGSEPEVRVVAMCAHLDVLRNGEVYDTFESSPATPANPVVVGELSCRQGAVMLFVLSALLSPHHGPVDVEFDTSLLVTHGPWSLFDNNSDGQPVPCAAFCVALLVVAVGALTLASVVERFVDPALGPRKPARDALP